MQIGLQNTNFNIGFKAEINYNRPEILNSLNSDKRLTDKDYQTIFGLLERVDTFKKMPESSIVEIVPRVDNGQVNLISSIYDKNKTIKAVADPRSVRKLVQDPDFQKRYLKSVSSSIKNVEKAKEGLDKVAEVILNSKNIKGFTINNSAKKPLTPENLDKYLEIFSFKFLYIKTLEKGYDPTKQIVRLIKAIDKKAKDKDVYLGVERELKRHARPYFTVETVKGGKVQKRKVPLGELFKLPLEYRLTSDYLA